jgi:hypothetical protein
MLPALSVPQAALLLACAPDERAPRETTEIEGRRQPVDAMP